MALAIGVGLNASRLANAARRLAFPDLRRFEAIKVGMTEAEVISRLGPPYKAYNRDTAPADYYVKSYGYTPRAITHKVYIYISGEPILYVYFNRSDRVEHVNIGGT